MNIKVLCTIDDLVDTLEYCKILSYDKDFKIKIFLIFRSDKAFTIEEMIILNG